MEAAEQNEPTPRKPEARPLRVWRPTNVARKSHTPFSELQPFGWLGCAGFDVRQKRFGEAKRFSEAKEVRREGGSA
jgi:hypothetical protein